MSKQIGSSCKPGIRIHESVRSLGGEEMTVFHGDSIHKEFGQGNEPSELTGRIIGRPFQGQLTTGLWKTTGKLKTLSGEQLCT